MESALQSLTLEELKTLRSDALVALAKLHQGQRLVSVTIGGRDQRYQEGEADKLERWIGQIQAAISAKESGRPVRAPLFVRL